MIVLAIIGVAILWLLMVYFMGQGIEELFPRRQKTVTTESTEKDTKETEL